MDIEQLKGNLVKTYQPISKETIRNKWFKRFLEMGTLWLHNGDPKQSHVLIPSGHHSNGFFKSQLVLENELLLRELVADLIFIFLGCGGSLYKIDRVVGPAKLAELLSLEINKRRSRVCFWSSPLRKVEGGIDVMVFDPEQHVCPHESVLLCDDVIGTGGSINLMAEAVTKFQGTVLPFVVALMERSDLKKEGNKIGGRKVVALTHRSVSIWKPGDCPLCREGSQVLSMEEGDLVSVPVEIPTE